MEKRLALAALGLLMCSQWSHAETGVNIIKMYAPIKGVPAKAQPTYDFTITPTSLTPGVVGTAYSFDLNTLVSWTSSTSDDTAQKPALAWSVDTLPAGLSLSTAGLITGTPTQTGTSSLTTTASEALKTHSANLALTVTQLSQATCKDVQAQRPGSQSGVYSLQVAGKSITAYCDMDTDGGGWTLVGRGAPGAPGQWSYSSADLALPANPSPNANFSFKFADDTINAMPKTAYRVVSTGYNNTRFWKGACVYNQMQAPTGDCSISYATVDWTGARGNGLSGGGGMADHRASVANDGYYISTSAPSQSYGWSGGNGTTSANVGTGTSGTIMGIVMWIR